MWFLLCLEILHFDKLVNWLSNLVLEGALEEGGAHTNILKTDFSRSVTKNERHTYRVNEHTTYNRDVLVANHYISNRCKYHTFHSYIYL